MMIFFANMCSKVSFGRNKSTNTSDFENHTLKTHIEGSAIANSDSSPLAKFNIYFSIFRMNPEGHRKGIRSTTPWERVSNLGALAKIAYPAFGFDCLVLAHQQNTAGCPSF